MNVESALTIFQCEEGSCACCDEGRRRERMQEAGDILAKEITALRERVKHLEEATRGWETCAYLRTRGAHCSIIAKV